MIQTALQQLLDLEVFHLINVSVESNKYIKKKRKGERGEKRRSEEVEIRGWLDTDDLFEGDYHASIDECNLPVPTLYGWCVFEGDLAYVNHNSQ